MVKCDRKRDIEIVKDFTIILVSYRQVIYLHDSKLFIIIIQCESNKDNKVVKFIYYDSIRRNR